MKEKGQNCAQCTDFGHSPVSMSGVLHAVSRLFLQAAEAFRRVFRAMATIITKVEPTKQGCLEVRDLVIWCVCSHWLPVLMISSKAHPN